MQLAQDVGSVVGIRRDCFSWSYWSACKSNHEGAAQQHMHADSCIDCSIPDAHQLPAIWPETVSGLASAAMPCLGTCWGHADYIAACSLTSRADIKLLNIVKVKPPCRPLQASPATECAGACHQSQHSPAAAAPGSACTHHRTASRHSQT